MDDAAVMGRLASWWQARAVRSGIALTFSSLCVQLGRRSDRESAAFLVGQALDLVPGSIEALRLLELATSQADTPDLCVRYEAFLAQAPTHPESARIRERLIAMLFAYGHPYSALAHVDDALTALGAPGPSEEEIARATKRLLDEQHTYDELDALEWKLGGYADYTGAEAAE